VKARTLEEAHQICKRNANGKTGERDPKIPLQWDRETVTTIVSDCGRYRISRRYVKDEDLEGWFLSSISPPKHIAGPFLLPKDARDAAQRHANGEPLQADLS
jgi:hypothetical protein